MASVIGLEVASFIAGDEVDARLNERCTAAAATIWAYAKNFTRGNGFDGVTGEPKDDIRQVIVAASARLAGNPEQIDTVTGSEQIRGSFQGWNSIERIILGSYRRQASATPQVVC